MARKPKPKARAARKPARSTSRTAPRKTAARTTKSAGSRKTAARKTASRKRAARPQGRRKQATGTRRRLSRTKSALSKATGLVTRAVRKTVETVAAHTPWAGGREDAVQLLERDHRRLEALLEQGEDTTERAITTRNALLDTITAELAAHELMEEKVLYPALKAHAETRDIVLEGYQEHHVADVIVKELHALEPSDERWGAKFKVLKESIEHHIEEEEGEMFPTARSVLSRDELEELGARMADMKAAALPK